MRYLQVRWNHSLPTEPVEIYGELDDSGWELRKVEIFADGAIGFASATEKTPSTILGEKPWPPLEEIAKDPQFKPVKISKEEFERVWENRFNLLSSPK
jgi:hypothetical protein